MAKDNFMGIIKLVLVIILALLVISLVSTVVRFAFNDAVAQIVIVIILIVAILWLLGNKGQRKLKELIDGAG